jgi:hypothetical protein
MRNEAKLFMMLIVYGKLEMNRVGEHGGVKG